MRIMKLLGVLLLLLSICSMPGWAQTTTGDIAGTVTDSTGAVVPNATVVITNTDRNVVVRTVKTGSGGDYSAPLIPIGTYSIAVDAPSFMKFIKSGIILNVGDKLTVSAKLEVGAAQEEVTVQATPNEIQTQSPQASSVIVGTQVRELPLNGRNWEQLVQLSPGVSDSGTNDQLYVGAFAPQGTNMVLFSMNGGRREQNNYMVDGADNVDRGSNLTLLSFPSVDSIAEFKVLRGQYDPEYGRAASGQVNVVTRGGTSKLHGNVYEFWRNDMLNARPFASKYPVMTAHKPYLRYHNFGGTIGGPLYIPKIYEQTNKTFFFFSEEVRRNLTYTNATATVVNDAMLNGTFAHPVCVTFNADNSCAFTGTSIPTASFDPIAKAYITDVFSKFPRPTSGAFGFTSTMKNLFNFREEMIRIDHIFNEKFTVYGKILRDHIPTEEAQGLWTGVVVPGVGTTSTNAPGHQYNVRATITASPSLLIEPGYAYSYGAIVSDPIGLMLSNNSPTVASAVKLPFTSTLARIPNVYFSGGSPAASYGPYRDYNRNHTAFSNVTWIRGAHTFKFGVTYYHYNKSENSGSGNQGSYTFSNNGVPTGTNNFEQAWANFLLGRVGTFSQVSQDVTADVMDNQFEYYAQDTWRVRPNVTLTLGFRHSFFRQPTDANGNLGQFDPAFYDPAEAPCVTSDGNLDLSVNAAGKVVSTCNPNYNPYNGYIFVNPPTGGHKSPYGNKIGSEFNRAIAPRVGIAWDPWGNGKTSIRAGFGQFYDNGLEFGNAEINTFNLPGLVTSLSVDNSTFQNPTGGAARFSPAAPTIQSRVPIDYKSPYTNQWSLDVQREVLNGWIVDVGYYGNNGIHLPGYININQPAMGAYLKCTDATPCTSGANNISFSQTVGGVYYPALVTSGNSTKLNAIRPYVGYGPAMAFREIYTSNYNSLQTQLQKQFAGGSLINIAYTWAHTLTTYVADRSTGNIMPIQGDIRDYNYGPGVADRRHVFTANFVWSLPFYRDQQGLTGKLLGGWQVAGIQTFQSGLPATVSTQGTNDPTGSDCLLGASPVGCRAYQVGDPNSGGQHSYESWFNAGAFIEPPLGSTQLSNQRQGSVRQPGFMRTDLSIYKNLKFTERFGGQLRLESFNTFNHTNPIISSYTYGASTFNKIRSARDPRIVQLGIKLSF